MAWTNKFPGIPHIADPLNDFADIYNLRDLIEYYNRAHPKSRYCPHYIWKMWDDGGHWIYLPSSNTMPGLSGHAPFATLRLLEPQLKLKNGIVQPHKVGEKMQFINQALRELAYKLDTGRSLRSQFIKHTGHPEVKIPFGLSLELGVMITTLNTITLSNDLSKNSGHIWARHNSEKGSAWPGKLRTEGALVCMDGEEPPVENRVDVIRHFGVRDFEDSRFKADHQPILTFVYANEVPPEWSPPIQELEKWEKFNVDDLETALVQRRFTPDSAVALIAFLETKRLVTIKQFENVTQRLWRQPCPELNLGRVGDIFPADNAEGFR